MGDPTQQECHFLPNDIQIQHKANRTQDFFLGGVGRRVDLDKPTLKFIPKVKGTRAAATTWKKNGVRGGTQAALTSPQGSQ